MSRLWIDIPRASGAVPQALTLFGGARFIVWGVRHPFFSGIPTGPEAILRMPGISAPRPTLKWPCATLVRLVGCATNTVGSKAVAVIPISTNPVDGAHIGRLWYQRHGSGRMCYVSGYSRQSRLIHWASGFKPSWRGKVYRLAPEAPLLRECRLGTRHFWEYWARLDNGPTPELALERPCARLARYTWCSKYRLLQCYTGDIVLLVLR